MNYSPIALAGATWMLLCIGAADGRAELIQWSYSWSRTPTEVHANSPGSGYIALTDEGLKSAAGNSFLVATNLQAHSTASSASPDTFTNKPYTLGLYLQDQDSHQSGTVSFTGEFNGTLTANSSNIANTFTGQTTRTLTLGDHLYTVTIGPYTAPGPTGAVNSGSIAARAEVTISTIFHLPEPSSFVLAVLGMSGLMMVQRGRLAFRAKRQAAWRINEEGQFRGSKSRPIVAYHAFSPASAGFDRAPASGNDTGRGATRAINCLTSSASSRPKQNISGI